MLRRLLFAFMPALTILCAWLALSFNGDLRLTVGAVQAAYDVRSANQDSNYILEPRASQSFAPSTPQASNLPAGFVQQHLISGLNYPTSFAFLPDGRIFITEKRGKVRVFKDGQLLSTPVLDISSKVNNFLDRGLMNVGIDPNFDDNGYIYLYYTYEHAANASSRDPRTGRLSRFTVSGDFADPVTEFVLLGNVVGSPAAPSCNDHPEGADCLPADGWSHTGSSIRFGTDGMLWVSTGDASSFTGVDNNALRSQKLTSLGGKLLRIDPATGRGLSSNPFWDLNPDPTSNSSRVWAYGMRNPFRWNFRPGTTMPYIGDVGMNNWEELNLGVEGANMGWPCYEGPQQHAGYSTFDQCVALYDQVASGAATVLTPLLSLQHVETPGGPACLIGGAFYTATVFPAEYQGAYFYGDCVAGTLDYLHIDQNHRIAGGPFRFGTLGDGPTDIQVGADGNLYVLLTQLGVLSRIQPGRPQAPPQGTSYISDLPWTFMSNGWGPVERDLSVGDRGLRDGATITLNAITYTKGLGTNANSDVEVYLGGSCTSFTSDLGIDDEVGSGGSAVFSVWADGALLYQTQVMTGLAATRSVNVNLSGADKLLLSVREGGDGVSFDHADWAGARISCLGLPFVTNTTPTNAAAGVQAGTTISATFSKAMNQAFLTTAKVKLFKQGTAQPVTTALGYDAQSRTLTITPAAPLEWSTQYTATITGGTNGVRDTDGFRMAEDAVWSFTTNAPPQVTINQPLSNTLFKVGDVITYTGSAFDPEDGQLPPSALAWTVVQQHCSNGECHEHQLETSTGQSGSFVAPDHGDGSYFVIRLTVQDSTGLSSSASAAIHPQTIVVTLASVPGGLNLIYDDFMAPAPFTRTTIAGSTHLIQTLSPQQGLVFTGWSDGGAMTHQALVGTTDATFTAFFAAPTNTPTHSATGTASATNAPANTAVPPSTLTASPQPSVTYTVEPSATSTAVACTIEFTDVPTGSPFHSYIRCLACNNVLGGYEDGTFRPDAGITRGQLSKIVANAAGYDEEVAGQTFTDVPPDSTFYLHVERIATRGIVGGYADGTFRPGGPATRGQIAKVLSNAAGFTDTPTRQSFSDVATADTFYLYIERLASRGIIGGYADGKFRPSNNASRGQVAKMVANTFFPGCVP